MRTGHSIFNLKGSGVGNISEFSKGSQLMVDKGFKKQSPLSIGL